MKVLHIIDSLGLGGAQTVIKGIFESQRKNRNIFLFVLRKREINIEINHPNIKIFNSKAKYSLKPIKELREIIEKNKINVLHCHLFRSQFIGWRLKIKYFPKIKLIFHEHGEIFQNHLIYDYFMRKSKEEADLVIAVSKATKNELIERAKINSDKIKVLYNFVDLERFNPKKVKINVKKEKEKLGIKKDDFIIGFVGRLSKVKNCKYLIRALPILDFPYKVLIAGDGTERYKLERLAKKLGVYNKIIFLGYRSDVVFIYTLIDILVIPSLSESFGISLIEAQAMEVPVIASNVPALNEIIKDKQNGLLFEVKNSQDLAQKIELISKNEELGKELIKKGLETVKKYDLNNYNKKLNRLYGELI